MLQKMVGDVLGVLVRMSDSASRHAWETKAGQGSSQCMVVSISREMAEMSLMLYVDFNSYQYSHMM